MEISSVQNFYRMQNAQAVSRVKRPAEETAQATSAAQNIETDTVNLSADASFRASLAARARGYAAESTQGASPERIAALKKAYAGDNVPVSSKDIAASVMRSALGAVSE